MDGLTPDGLTAPYAPLDASNFLRNRLSLLGEPTVLAINGN